MSTDKPVAFRGVWRTDPAARGVYAEAAGIAQAIPAAVAVPADADDVVSLVTWAQRTRTALIPRGSGSSMAGGAIGNGVVVDLGRLVTRAPVVDERRRSTMVLPGTVRDTVDAAARTVGLRFPVDPSSGAFCTVGGMAGTNAAGARTLAYGPMRAWVTALDCIFDDGSRAIVRRGEIPPDVPAVRRFLADPHFGPGDPTGAPFPAPAVRKNSSGYSLADYARTGELLDLLVGSEGTLAIFVGVELALAPMPAATSSLLAAFDSLERAVDGAAVARKSAASACELLDRTFLDVTHGVHGLAIPEGTESLLMIELEATDRPRATAAAAALEREILAAGATWTELGLDEDSEAELWKVRHAASPILARLDPSLKSMQFIEDGCVPPAKLPDYVRGVRAALDAHETRGVIFGHAGDAHVHVNPLVDVSREGWRERMESLLGDVVALTARLGGTLSGEHGDGRLRAA
ncbi:MAG TPA: FAD-binding oxidoreductase, partial [Gemmatimonadaceae bacterium]|nr:FAD-binding oxidoreductase [Gemmatimonadaceae bacterium]